MQIFRAFFTKIKGRQAFAMFLYPYTFIYNIPRKRDNLAFINTSFSLFSPPWRLFEKKVVTLQP